MTPQELRIGNWLQKKQNSPIEYCRVTQVYMEGFTVDYHYPGGWYEPIPLTPELLEKCGFKGDVWKSIDILKWMVGEDGESNLILGRTSSPDGLPYHPGIQQHSKQGFTIQQAADIQKRDNNFNDDAFIMNAKHSVYLQPIKYLHQLQNLYFCLTGEELNIQL